MSEELRAPAHGLGPTATLVEDGPDGFMDVAYLVGENVYLEQGGALIVVSRQQATTLADAFTSSAAGQREGWKLVPVEATLDMVEACGLADATTWGPVGDQYREMWRAMLAASPSAPEERRDEAEHLRDRLRRKIMNSRLNDGYVPAYLAGWNAALDLLDAALTPVPGER